MGSRWWRVAAATVLSLVAAATVGAGLVTPTPAAGAVTPGRSIGVTLPGAPSDLTALNALSAELGAKPDVVMWYTAWSLRSAFPAADATRVTSWGATPEITWEPWDPSAGVTQPAYALARIAAGSYDSYLSSWAAAIHAWGRPLRLRFAHEMNGTWYPWAQGVNGNGAGSYVAAWRHVLAVFARLQVTNVTWIWSPNVPFTGSAPLASVFPGDSAVDEVALDGYNWSTLQAGSRWTSFADVFGDGYNQLSALSRRPMSIGEVGCPEVGGDKSAWIAGMWSSLAGAPRVRGLTWFDHLKEADWRIDSSASSAAAFAAGMASFRAS